MGLFQGERSACSRLDFVQSPLIHFSFVRSLPSHASTQLSSLVMPTEQTEMWLEWKLNCQIME